VSSNDYAVAKFFTVSAGMALKTVKSMQECILLS